MKLRMLAAGVAALGLLSMAAAAGAAVVVSDRVVDQLFTADGQSVIVDFDNPNAAFVSYAGDVRTSIEDPISTSAPPPYSGGVDACCGPSGVFKADPTNYASVQGAGTGLLSLSGGRYLTSFSFYMGSPDTYNHVSFNFVGGGHQDFDGDAIWGGDVLGNGDRSKGFRVYYDFGGAKVSSIGFASDNNAFEFDGLAGNVGVPEPATWALMIGGFGAAGAMLRRRRTLTA